MNPKTTSIILAVVVVVLVAMGVAGSMLFMQRISSLQSDLDVARASVNTVNTTNTVANTTTNTTNSTTNTTTTSALTKPYVAVGKEGAAYFDKDGTSKLIGKNNSDESDVSQIRKYRSAEISQNGKFVAMYYGKWEGGAVEIYDIATGVTHFVAASSGDFNWDDNKLSVINTAGIATSDETLRSTSTDKPWEVKKI